MTHLEIPAWVREYAEALGAVMGIVGAFFRGLFTASPRERQLEAALSALKGANTMNLLQSIPTMLTLGEDGVKLLGDLKDHDPKDAAAVIVSAAPALATLLDEPALVEILTPEKVGADLELLAAFESIKPQLQAAINAFKAKTPAPPVEQPAA